MHKSTNHKHQDHNTDIHFEVLEVNINLIEWYNYTIVFQEIASFSPNVMSQESTALELSYQEGINLKNQRIL